MDATLISHQYAVQTDNKNDLSILLMSQKMFEMNQLIGRMNKLYDELYRMEINGNYNQIYHRKAEEYNKLILEYNTLEHEYQLILRSATYNNNSNNITKCNSKWISLLSMPGTPFSNAVKINNEEFIFAIYNEHALLRYNAIYCYNIKKNEWREFLKYPYQFQIDPDGPILFNIKTNELYLNNGIVTNNINNPWQTQSKFAKINLNTKQPQWSLINSTRQKFAGSSLLIDDKLHLFGGCNNTKHRTYTFTEKEEEIKEEEIYDFSDNEWNIGNVQHGLIYIPNKHQILLFGGMNIPNYPRAFDTIWNYNILNKKWNILSGIKLPFKMYGFGHILSADQQCIIMFGGGKERDDIDDNNSSQCGYQFIDDIFVIELNDIIKIRKSEIICPKKGIFHALTMIDGNMKLINGYLTYYERIYGLRMPLDLRYLMDSFYKEEYVHILHRETCKHWKVDIVEIISNCTDYIK